MRWIDLFQIPKELGISFHDCIQCGAFSLCFNDSSLCVECWEILEEYWWLSLPLDRLAIRY